MHSKKENAQRTRGLGIQQRIDGLYLAMDRNLYIAALRHGLSLSIPFFLFGSLALVLLNLPVPAYQIWMRSVLSGRVPAFFLCLFHGTMGILSLVMLFSVSYSFGRLADPTRSGEYPLTCLASYFVFIIGPEGQISFEMFGSDWLFTAIMITLGCCGLLHRLLRLSKAWHDRHYHEGIDLDFQNVMVSLLPVAVCLTVCLLLKLLVIWTLGGIDLENVGSQLFTALFQRVGTGFWGSVLFIFLIHILWFFGIHGSNMLGMVADRMFETGIAVNAMAIAQGEAPQVLFTKTFFDCFVLMGGSGATLGLLLALLIVRKRDHSDSLLKCAILPSLFNVNELVLFGFPVVFNPIMLIPFVMVPLTILCTSTLAMSMGLVPLCSQNVIWTAPILYSGWKSTGSWTGAVLQVVNLCISAAIYLPFIRLSNRYYSNYLKKTVTQLRDAILTREETGNTSSLHSTEYQQLQDVIKLMTEDLRHALNSRKISLFYQPQFNLDGSLHGLEALLRWNHPSLGFQYPPMVIELAREDGLLQEMGYQIIETAAFALERLSREIAYPFDLAVNISPDQLEDREFCSRVREILDRHDFGPCKLCFEITEQIALSSTDVIRQRIGRLHDMGIEFHMDDFGMGHSSIIYLQYNVFNTVKLDGSLVKDMVENPQAQEIISGIAQMSAALHYDLIAEYVETEKQRDLLAELGCSIYQGYLYSPALDLTSLESYLENRSVITCREKKCPSERELYL